MRIPANIITENKYTIGKEFINRKTHKLYQGYYYELNNKFFAGKEFNTKAPEIIRITSSKFNPLLDNPKTAAYAKISKVRLDNQSPSSIIYQYDSNARYFCYQIIDKIIKEINKETFNKFKINPLYLTAMLSYTTGFNSKELDETEKQIPGIKAFVNTSYTNPKTEDDGTVG
jgi:hypothetical protein